MPGRAVHRYNEAVQPTSTRPLSAPRPTVAGRGRPLVDPGCAGCGQLLLLRALRRAGLEVTGGLGCEPAAPADPALPPARLARLGGAAEALLRPAALLAEGRASALLVVGDRGPHRLGAVEAALALAGAQTIRFAPQDAADAERLVAAARAEDAVLLSLVACVRAAPRASPLAIAPARCNRCGACVGLGCAAISDPGGEAMVIDPDACSGCGLCAPLCRSRAIGR